MTYEIVMEEIRTGSCSKCQRDIRPDDRRAGDLVVEAKDGDTPIGFICGSCADSLNTWIMDPPTKRRNTVEVKKIENSSNIANLEYDGEKQELRVTFLSGSTYEYLRVMPEDFENLANASSVGGHFNKAIKGKFHAMKIE